VRAARSGRLGRLVGGIAVLAIVSTTTAPASQAASDVITEHSTAPGSGPRELTLAPSGNAVWFTEASSGTLGDVSDQGRYSRFFIPTKNSQPSGITAGPDGNIWFTESSGNKIGRVVSFKVNEYPLPSPSSEPRGITAGPDGALWFTEGAGNRIGRITTAGRITQFTVPTARSDPARIAAGADGALWFTEQAGGRIGRITTAGKITQYPLPTSATGPFGITAGPDGNIWFTEGAAGKIGVITPAGVITEYTLAPGSAPRDIAAGTDGTMWFTDAGTNQIGQITTSGVVSEFTIPSQASSPFGITTGIRGAVWFTESAANRVSELDNTAPHTQYVSVAATYIEQNPPRATLGTTVQWTFFGPNTESVTDATGMGLYDSDGESFVSSFSYTFTAAGDYPYRSTTGGLSATYKVVPFVNPGAGGVSTPFTVTWASQAPAPGFAFDVEVKRPGSSQFTPWRAQTTATSGQFTPDAGTGTYQFEARLVDTNTSPATGSGWSPSVSVSVT
jgi:virginiamycin B lyase